MQSPGRYSSPEERFPSHLFLVESLRFALRDPRSVRSAAVLARLSSIPALVKNAFGHRTLAASIRVANSFSVKFTFTWIVRLCSRAMYSARCRNFNAAVVYKSLSDWARELLL